MNKQNVQKLNGDQALAYGALASGVKLVTSYPGSPGIGTVETMVEFARDQDIFVEWSSNEKVAIEMGIGASIAGRRALVCAKSVGMNLMVDPLMVLNLTPVRGGLVILLGDDPGAYGSQNDQDTRPLAHLIETPMIEPADPGEAFIMIQEAFSISERFQIPVIIRETRSFTQQVGPVEIGGLVYPDVNQEYKRESWRFVPVPKNAVAKHKELHARVVEFRQWADVARYNQISGAGTRGIIAAGFAYQKLIDLLGTNIPENLKVLKLSTLYPLPIKLISGFLETCEQVLILEENEPFIESQIKALAHDLNSPTRVSGKQSGHVPQEGELYRWQIQNALSGVIPDFNPAHNYLQDNEAKEVPKKESFCGDAGYDIVLDVLEAAAADVEQELILVGDPGCLVTVAERLDAKYAIGSAVAVADGISKTGVAERAVALLGDSAFFHTTIPAICNVVHNRSDILIVVLDNGSTASTGYQPHPGVGKDALGEKAPKISIPKIATACGINQVHLVAYDDINSKLRELFKQVLNMQELALVIVQTKPPI